MNAEEFLKMKLNVSGRQYMDDWSANDVIEVMEEYAKAKAGQHETIVMLPFININDWYPDGLGGVDDFDKYLVLVEGTIYHAFYIGDRYFKLLHNNEEVIPSAWLRFKVAT